MKTITIYQPWAHLIATGRKRYENRVWKTAHRGPLLIHAGATRKLVESRPDLMAMVERPEYLAFGAIVAIVDLVDVVPLAAVAGEPYAVGPWCWVLADATPLGEPMPWRGAQRLFEVPDCAAIRAAMAARS